MFRCWGCGNDYPDVPYASKAEASMWESKAREEGYAAALRDAVEAVKAIEHSSGCNLVEPDPAWQTEPFECDCPVTDAVAAIEALSD